MKSFFYAFIGADAVYVGFLLKEGAYRQVGFNFIMVVTCLLCFRIGSMAILNYMRDAAETGEAHDPELLFFVRDIQSRATEPKNSPDKQTIEGDLLILQKSDTWEGFDPDSKNFPEELDIALQAWRAVSNSGTEGRVKEQLETWVKNHYPHLPPSTISRIAVVCNWDKRGGAPKAK